MAHIFVNWDLWTMFARKKRQGRIVTKQCHSIKVTVQKWNYEFSAHQTSARQKRTQLIYLNYRILVPKCEYVHTQTKYNLNLIHLQVYENFKASQKTFHAIQSVQIKHLSSEIRHQDQKWSQKTVISRRAIAQLSIILHICLTAASVTSVAH